MAIVCKSGLKIRWMVRRDLRDVLAIEREAFDSPWTRRDFVTTLGRVTAFGMVAEWYGRIVGFMIYELAKRRFHLLNMAVAAEHRRQGVGSHMLAFLQSELKPKQIQAITVEVGDRNLGAHLFLRANGFRAVAVVPNYFDEPPEDAYRFVYILRQTVCKESGGGHEGRDT